MTKAIYHLYDKVAQTVVGGIITANNDNVAMRDFTDALKNPQSVLHTHPEDFNLLVLGHLEDDGTLVPCPGGPMVVSTGQAWALAQAEIQGAR